jgi:RNA polymerase sigma-70 factor (sigma-E family)
MRAEDEHGFREVALARAPALRRLAFAVCGDWHRADDLAQDALIRLYGAWPLRDAGAVDAWLKRTLVRAWIDERRRPWWRREHSVSQVPEPASAAVWDGDLPSVLHVLDLLPPRQRACLVLRFLEDWSVEQTADALGCSTGTVKSQTSRGLVTARRWMDVEAQAAAVDAQDVVGDAGTREGYRS